MISNKDSLKAFLKTRFPRSNIKFVGEGWASTAFIVDDNILRFPKGQIEEYDRETGVKSYVRNIADDYKREAIITNFIRNKINVQVPDITVIEDSKYPYAIHKMLPGKTWDIPEIKNLDSKAQDLLTDNIAAFLYSLHKINIDDLKKKMPGLAHEKPKMLDLADIEPFLRNYLSANEIKTIYKKYDIASNRKIDDIVFSHGDFGQSNSLINSNHRLTGVIDWADSGLIERALDFHSLYDLEHIDFLLAVLKKYENLSGIRIDIERIKEILLIDAVGAVYWGHINEYMKKMIDKEMNRWIVNNLKWFV